MSWSSSEYNTNNAWIQCTGNGASNGGLNNNNKNNNNYVRPVLAFLVKINKKTGVFNSGFFCGLKL